MWKNGVESQTDKMIMEKGEKEGQEEGVKGKGVYTGDIQKREETKLE